MLTLVNAARFAGQNGQRQESFRQSQQAIQLARQVDNPFYEVPVRFLASSSAVILGDLEKAKEHAQAALPPAEKLRNRLMLAVALGTNEVVARVEGDFSAARQLTARALAASSQDIAIFHTQMLLEAQVGNLTRIEEILEQSMEQWTIEEGRGFRAGIIAVIWYSTGLETGLDLAEREARTTLSSPTRVNSSSQAESRAALGLIAINREDLEEVQEHYNALMELRGSLRAGLIADDRLLGILSHAIGQLNQAEAHFEDALAFCRKAGYRPELAWTCCDYADTLLQRASTSSAQTEDREKAMSLLDESLAISSELGMRPLMERALSRREILKA